LVVLLVVLPDAMIACNTNEMILTIFANIEVASKGTGFRVVKRSSDAHTHTEVLASKRPAAYTIIKWCGCEPREKFPHSTFSGHGLKSEVFIAKL
jgi:hypothetical protein